MPSDSKEGTWLTNTVDLRKKTEKSVAAGAGGNDVTGCFHLTILSRHSRLFITRKRMKVFLKTFSSAVMRDIYLHIHIRLGLILRKLIPHFEASSLLDY